LEGGDFRVSAQHEQAVEAGVGLDFGPINDKAVAHGRREETAEAFVGDQCLVALRELALEAGDQFGARLGILSGFLVVATDDVAPPGDCGLPDGEFSLALLPLPIQIAAGRPYRSRYGDTEYGYEARKPDHQYPN
jgi:hypothetical protein